MGLVGCNLLASVEVGKAAPEFGLQTVQGKALKLSDYAGKIVVLEWVNPGCPFVKAQYEASGLMPKLQKELAGQGVVWISINSGKPGAQGDLNAEQVTAWMKETGANPTAYCRDQDGKVGHLYGAKTTPHLFVIGKDGLLKYQGAIGSVRSVKPEELGQAENYVKSAVNALLAGKPVEKSSTQPFGCSVKY